MTRRSRILTAAVLGLLAAHPLAGRAADAVAGKTGLPPLPPPNNPVVPAAVTPAAPAPAIATPKAPAPATVTSAAPAAAPMKNGEVAGAVADVLRQAGKSGQLRYYNIDLNVKEGTTELSGTVASQAQREEVLKLVKGVAGVSRVVDRMAIQAPNPIAQVQATGPIAPVLQAPPGVGAGGPPVAPPPEVAPPPQVRDVAPPPMLVPGPASGVIPEPIPTFAASMPSPYDLNPPQMPPYAWPTYAPYNNFSRVAYPLAYPYQSWPYIGPAYPFPKIPPGWRSVKLEWEDGHWWYSRVSTKNDWWRLRFW